jgi:predicted amidohydrolase
VDIAANAGDTVDIMSRYLTERIGQVLPDQPDLIVLPKVCDLPANYPATSDTTLHDYLNARGDRVQCELAKIAHEQHCYIAYPALRHLPDGTWRNSITLLDRRGDVICIYDKCHPTVWENEAGILSGTGPSVAQRDFGRVGLLVCFDLNFEPLRQQYAYARPDVLAFSSMYHGGLMQAYWAYSCRAHFAGAIANTGGYVLSPLGERLAASTNYFDFTSARINLDCWLSHLDYNWERLHALRAKYGPRVKVHDPGFLGSVLVSSEADDVSIDQLIGELGIELLDNYLERAMD